MIQINPKHRIVEDEIQRLLDDTPAGRKYRLVVQREATREEDDWLYIAVAPGAPGIRALEFVDVLGDVEQLVRQSQSRNEILVVPATQ